MNEGVAVARADLEERVSEIASMVAWQMGLRKEQVREIEKAAILHDIGYLIHSSRHHKHTYYLITEGDLHAFTGAEIEMIANVARYHRRALPRDSHEPLKKLTGRDRRTMEILSAILRIADGLDRSHFAVVEGVRVKLGKPVTIVVETCGDPELELWAARGRANLFEKVFKVAVEFSVKKLRGETP